MLKIHGFPTQNNGCGKYRVWDSLKAISGQNLAEVTREPDEPQPISVEKVSDIFRKVDVVFCQPFSELWAACIFMAARDEHKKKLVVDLDDNVWAIHPMNMAPVKGRLTGLKSHFSGRFDDFWAVEPIKESEITEYSRRIDGTVVRKDDGTLHFLKNKQPDVKLTVEFMLRAADAVTTTNEVLAEVIRKHTDRPVWVLPNYLDLKNWQKAKPAPEKWVGWCGSVSHYPDLKPLVRSFDSLMHKYDDFRLQIMGSSFDYLFPLKKDAKRLPVAGYGPSDAMFYADLDDSEERWPGRMRFDKPVPIQEYESWIASNWQSRVGLAPICHNDFNDAKSELKWLEYTALGIPTVASNFGPYRRAIRDGIDGLLTPGRAWKDWEGPISWLLDNPKPAQTIVDAATERLHQEYDINKQAKKWLEVFEITLEKESCCAVN